MSSSISHAQAMRYSRHIMLAGFDLDKQEELLQKRVLLLGVGGLGCAAAQYLVTSGIRLLTLVDDDRVSVSNLQRQTLHTETAVGMNKCESARTRLHALNSAVEIHTQQRRLDDDALQALVREHDIVLDCSDNLATREQLNRACLVAKVPLVCGAAIRVEGQIFCMLPAEKSACYQCMSQFFSEPKLSCSEAGVLSPVVGIIGAMQALQAIKILVEFGQPETNCLHVFDGMTLQWQRFNLPKNLQCPACGDGNNEASGQTLP